MMRRRTYALLVLDAAAWGRATFGLQLARDLHLQGDRVGTTGTGLGAGARPRALDAGLSPPRV
jgi:hypothetical protein